MVSHDGWYYENIVKRIGIEWLMYEITNISCEWIKRVRTHASGVKGKLHCIFYNSYFLPGKNSPYTYIQIKQIFAIGIHT